jgi:hypothetical protein
MNTTVLQTLGGAHTVFKTAAAAEAALVSIKAYADGLTYTVVVDPNGSGKAIVHVLDEDGNYIDTL